MKQYKVNKKFITQKLGKNLTIFDSEASYLFTFNETASFIFNQLKKSAMLEKIAKSLSQTYMVPYDNALVDVKNMVVELRRKKIIYVAEVEKRSLKK